MRVIMLVWPFPIYLLLIVCAYVQLIKLQHLIVQQVPGGKSRYLGSDALFGINRKMGLMLIFDEDVKKLGITNEQIRTCRKRAGLLVLGVLVFLAAMPLYWIAVVAVL